MCKMVKAMWKEVSDGVDNKCIKSAMWNIVGEEANERCVRKRGEKRNLFWGWKTTVYVPPIKK